jgi:fused signal recognition particle receptor
LILADAGIGTAEEASRLLRERVKEKGIKSGDGAREELRSILRERLETENSQLHISTRPSVILMVGVNGVGKTTTIGKLAARFTREGKQVVLCAADTFRAAASEQLEIWSTRAGVPLIQQKHGTDPAAVLFDALQSAKSRNSDVLIVDTAGRLHNKANLMAELEKMKRIAGREVPKAPHETLLVIDAVTGQNGLEQARQFMKAADVTGIVLTKLDGTAKGGIAVAIAKELQLPIRYVGVGEQVDDLMVFDPESYVNGLFD